MQDNNLMRVSCHSGCQNKYNKRRCQQPTTTQPRLIIGNGIGIVQAAAKMFVKVQIQ